MLPRRNGGSLRHQSLFRCLSRLLVVMAILTIGQAWAADPIPVHCPALDFEKRVVINGPGGPEYPVTLIALGKTKEVDAPARRSRKVILEIEEVLYGDQTVKRAEFESSWAGGHRAIFFLAPTGWRDGPAYEESHTWEVENLAVARVLAAARLAELVCNASSIFVGEGADEDSEKWKGTNGPPTRVKVITNLAGQKFPEKEAVVVGRMPHRFAGPHLYILHGGGYRYPDTPTMYDWKAVLPLPRKSEVLATLAKRDQYPLVENPADSTRPRFREYVYGGTAKQALDLLASENDSAEVLGHRFFLHHPEDARALLVPQIEGALLRTGEAKEDEYRLQRRCIRTLGLAERKAPTGAVAALAEKLIRTLEDSPAPVPIPKERRRQTDGRYYGGPMEEEDTVDVNHTLVWLLQQLPEEEATRRWGERLLALKTRLNDWWQQEVALAADVLRLGVARELETALARMKSVSPVRSGEEAAHKIAQVYFSADSRRLWSFGEAGSRGYWDVETMKLKDLQAAPEGTMLLSTSLRDGRYQLYLERKTKLPENATPMKVSAVAAETGKLLSTMNLALSDRSRFGWHAGGQFVVTNGQTITLADATSGKVLRQVAYPERNTPCYISPDRSLVLTGLSMKGQEYLRDRIDLTTGVITNLDKVPREERPQVDGLPFERLLDPREYASSGPLAESWPKKLPNLRGHQVLQLLSSADQKRLVILTRALLVVDGAFDNFDHKAPIVVRIYDAASLRMIGALEVARVHVDAYLNRDGSQLVLVHQTRTSMERWPLPPK